MVGWKDDRCMNTWIGGQKNSGLRDQRKNFIKEVGLHCALVCREKWGVFTWENYESGMSQSQTNQ